MAGGIEESFALEGFPVFSNARNHRQSPRVPLVSPMVNAEHLEQMVPIQQAQHRGGYIVTNPNCTTTGLVRRLAAPQALLTFRLLQAVALKPLHEAYGLEKVMVFTMQAVSGAGYPGLAAIDMIDNVVPYIGNEEEKVQSEPLKMFGTWNAEAKSVTPAEIAISAHCNRVPVTDGHTETVSIAFKRKPKSLEEVRDVLAGYMPRVMERPLPSLPERPIEVAADADRPQPRLDRGAGNGFTTVVGRLRHCPLFDLKLVLVSHNTIAGAAGGALLNAEFATDQGLVKPRA